MSDEMKKQKIIRAAKEVVDGGNRRDLHKRVAERAMGVSKRDVRRLFPEIEDLLDAAGCRLGGRR